MRAIIWITIATLAAGYGLFAYLTLDRRGDEEQLSSIFARTAQAAEKRDLSGTIACVSAKYKDADGLNHDRLRMLTAQALQTEQKFTVDYTLKSTKILGDVATVEVALKVKGADGVSTIYNRDLTVVFTKESGRHALIMPASYWRVTSVDGLGLAQELGI